MNDRKKINWNRIITKALVVFFILFVPALGIHYRPKPDFDYSAVNTLETENGAIKADFDFLGGFDYERDESIPEKVKELSGKTVSVTGFMLPIDFDAEGVRSFMMLNHRKGCCFDSMPRVNEFVYVQMPEGKSTKYMTDIPLRVTGKLEVVNENLVGGIYSMTADRVEVVKSY
ncbi:MAG TPA: DUF3299 domain-containing protein [Thermodesulfobacteriota bacterium]|nr:DUF3299 domain-containing protein [Thermodesulfobacteriota bacterium]